MSLLLIIQIISILVLVLSSILVGYPIYRHVRGEKVRNLESNSKKNREDPGDHFFLRKNTLFKSKDISLNELSEGIKQLIEYTHNLNPDYIVGLNRGGVLVGAYIALATTLPSKKFGRCCIYFENQNSIIECEIGKISGTVLLVDDITRTGRTVSEAIKYLQKSNKNIKVHVATIVAVTTDKNKRIIDSVDFCAIGVENSEIKLPWHFEGDPETSKHREKDDLKQAHISSVSFNGDEQVSSKGLSNYNVPQLGTVVYSLITSSN
jgi:adenine/guanine phosphoribosyltransferase-like PRPP-binding protein